MNTGKTLPGGVPVSVRVIITHPEQGVYLGNCMGLGFWSKLDPAGQDSAVLFADNQEAVEHIRSWDSGNNPEAYKLLDVETLSLDYASHAQCVRAGVEAWL